MAIMRTMGRIPLRKLLAGADGAAACRRIREYNIHPSCSIELGEFRTEDLAQRIRQPLA
jgi:hypothetical protein